MKALDRKLLRDLRLMWSQALTIALVVASGVGGFLTTLSAVDSLAHARDAFYASGRFADVFASVKRAPDALAETLRAIPGVADVQTTSEFYVRIQLIDAGLDSHDPIIGQLIGIDRRQPPRMNRITLRSGLPDDPVSMSPGRALPDGALPAWVSESLRRGARAEAGRTAARADQRQAARARDRRRGAVARVHLRRPVRHARPARLRHLLGRRRGAGCGLRHGGRLQPRRAQARARRRRARGDRRAAAPPRPLRRARGARPRRPGLARDARQRDQGACT